MSQRRTARPVLGARIIQEPVEADLGVPGKLPTARWTFYTWADGLEYCLPFVQGVGCDENLSIQTPRAIHNGPILFGFLAPVRLSNFHMRFQSFFRRATTSASGSSWRHRRDKTCLILPNHTKTHDRWKKAWSSTKRMYP